MRLTVSAFLCLVVAPLTASFVVPGVPSSPVQTQTFVHRNQASIGWTALGWQQSVLTNVGSIRGGHLTTSTQTYLLPAAVTSVVAGSVAGAVGVGVAFPLDTLKTKSQVLRQEMKSDSDGALAVVPESGESSLQLGMLKLIGLIYQTEGLAGFFGGVRGMMAGQALIKALAFSANDVSLKCLEPYTSMLTSVAVLILAACFSGFVTSFLVAPVERVKVMMQASGNSLYGNEIDCLKAVVRSEGWGGLVGRGLGATIAREVPSYGIYFVVYGFMMKTAAASFLGALAPLVFGALSGMACWIPVYPIDVVKTLVQNTEGSDEDKSAWEVTKQLYEEDGVGGFFDGLTPKMLRASVNHSVTFFMYDLVMKALTVSG